MNAPRLLAAAALLLLPELACSSSDAPTAASGAGGGLAHAGSSSGGGGVGGGSAGRSSGGAGGQVSFGGTAGSGALGGSTAGSAGSAAGSGGTGGWVDTMVRPGWNLVWHDEFDGASGERLDGSKWKYDNGPNNANKELEYYSDRPENSGKDGQGHYVITSRHEEFMDHHYTSAKFTSSGTYEPKFGRLETRVKLPKGKGVWPAFWALGTNIGNVGWPDCGEIDIMEAVGDALTTNHGSLHGPGYSGDQPLTGTYKLPSGTSFADDFHVFAAEWEQDVVRFYVDDHLYETHVPSEANGTWVFNQKFFMIMNVAVGGTWPGTPDDSIFPTTMSIDYVRVYSR